MSFRAAFYKGTRPGVQGIYSRAVRGWEQGPYSHCEMIFSDGVSASASFADGGVRFKAIDYEPGRWDFIDLPAEMEAEARQWFIDHEDEPYDLIGNVHFIVGFIPQGESKKFCSEALGAALRIPDPWRFGPNGLATLLTYLTQPASAGFLLSKGCAWQNLQAPPLP